MLDVDASASFKMYVILNLSPTLTSFGAFMLNVGEATKSNDEKIIMINDTNVRFILILNITMDCQLYDEKCSVVDVVQLSFVFVLLVSQQLEESFLHFLR